MPGSFKSIKMFIKAAIEKRHLRDWACTANGERARRWWMMRVAGALGIHSGSAVQVSGVVHATREVT